MSSKWRKLFIFKVTGKYSYCKKTFKEMNILVSEISHGSINYVTSRELTNHSRQRQSTNQSFERKVGTSTCS